MPTFEDYFVVGKQSGFHSYTTELSGLKWYLGVFESDNTIAPRNILTTNNTDINMLLVGGGGGGGLLPVSPEKWGYGGGGGGHLLIKSKVTNSPSSFLPLKTNTVYDIIVGKGGVSQVGNGSWFGGNTLFGYRQYGTLKCPEVSGGKGGNNSSPGEKGTTISTGENINFINLNSGTGGNGGAAGDYSGQPNQGASGAGASAVNINYGNPNEPGNYYIGPLSIFGSISVGGGGGGGSGSRSIGLTGEGGNAGDGGIGGTGGSYPPSLSPSGEDAEYSVVNIAPNHTLKAGSGGGGVGYYNSGSFDGGNGANGVFMVWFQGPPISTDPTFSFVTPYYTLSYSETAIASNLYGEVTFPNTRKIGYYTSIVVGGKNANIEFTPSMTGLSAEILLVGGGGGGGGSNDAITPSPGSTYAGSGGGGGGHLYGYGIVGTQLNHSITYDISLGDGGIGRFGPTQGDVGENSIFGANQWITPAEVSGGGGGGAQSNNSATGTGGNIINAGQLIQISGGNGGGGGAGADVSFPDVSGGYNGLNAANGVGGDGTYNFIGFGTITVGGGGGGGGGMRSPSQRDETASGDGGSAGFGAGGAGGQGPSINGFFRAQSAIMSATNNSAVAGGGGGGGGVPFSISTGEIGSFGGDGGSGLFAVRVAVVLSPGTATLTPIANLEPYITTGTSTNFTAYEFVQPFPDTSQITWYLGVFEGNNTITPNTLLDDIDVNILLVGGGGGGGGGTNVTQAISGGGGGGGGHMLIQAKVGEPEFQIGTSYSIQVGTGGTGGVGLASGNNGGNTTFGSNIGPWTGLFPDVSGGGGGGNIGRGDTGAITRTGASLGFTILNNNNNGAGGQGGLGSQGSSSFFTGGQGGYAVPVNELYGNPGQPGWYYVGPFFGSFFGLLKVSGSGGGGGGNYDISGTEPVIYGQGGFAGNEGIGGFGGFYSNSVQPPAYSNGENASYTVAIGSFTSSSVGAGGGGAGQPGVSVNSTGGAGVNGIFMIWFAVPTPVIYANPYYSLACVNSNVIDVSNEQVFYDGSKKTYYTSVITGGLFNSIKFLADASGLDAHILLVGGGGGGGGGTNQIDTFSGQGGGGGGHILGSGTVGSTFTIDVSYNIDLGNGGQSGGGANQGNNGTGSYLGRNVWSPYTYVTAGGGGSARNGGGPATGGDISNNGMLTYIRGGTGGSGGSGGNTSFPIVTNGIKGGDAAIGNTDISGLYIFPGYGAIGVAGGGGGGGGLQEPFAKYGDISGEGGFAGFGIGGIGGISPYYDTSYNGENAPTIITSGYSVAGGGGGGGGIPYDPSNTQIAAQGGSGSDGLFAVHLELDTPAPPPPTPGPTYVNEYFAFDNSNSELYIKWLDPSASCVCGGLPSIQYVAITTTDNVLRFFPPANGAQVDFVLVGAGGQGGGSINSVVKSPGQGGGGGGIGYGTGVIGGNVAYDVSYNIELGFNTQLGGYGVYDGTDGSGSRFGANVWSPWFEVSGGGGGGVLDVAGNGGNVITYGPLINTFGGTGGNGGLQFPNGDGITGDDAVNGTSGLSGRFIIPNYGNVICSGGGGGGAGISGEETYGSGGMAGRGNGGHGGTLNAHPPEGADAETLVEEGLSLGGGGGGGAGITHLEEEESVGYGGGGAKGLFMMFFHRPDNCNPVHPICGCQTFDAICGCGILSKCPTPVEYTPLNTGGNDPKINPALAYALYVRGSLGRPGYQRYRVGNQPLNPFGSYAGAPGGSRAPPRNNFG